MDSEFKASLGRHLLELLRESPHGLTPPTLLELALERGWAEQGRGRGAYQRILRLLAQFEARGLVRKVGRRYVANTPALDEAAEAEALATLRLVLSEAHLPVPPETWISKLKHLLKVHGETHE
jgi:hypothetical protein